MNDEKKEEEERDEEEEERKGRRRSSKGDEKVKPNSGGRWIKTSRDGGKAWGFKNF